MVGAERSSRNGGMYVCTNERTTMRRETKTSRKSVQHEEKNSKIGSSSSSSSSPSNNTNI